MISKETPPLFVYGTLASWGDDSHRLGTVQRRPARIRGELYHLRAGYPAARSMPEGWVHGEVVDAPTKRMFELLDLYEGVHEGLYERVLTEAWCGPTPIAAWVYLMADAHLRRGHLLPSGRWHPVIRR